MPTATQEPRTLVETSTPGWYEDPNDSSKKTRARSIDKIVSREEYQQMLSKVDVAETGKPLMGPTTTITCVDCGKKRKVKVQDRFQVKRCAKHQKAHRNKLRREKRAKAKKAS